MANPVAPAYSGSVWDWLSLNAEAAGIAIGNTITNPAGAISNAGDYYVEEIGGNSNSFQSSLKTSLKWIGIAAVAGLAIYVFVESGGPKKIAEALK